jgi:hypothetical protein
LGAAEYPHSGVFNLLMGNPFRLFVLLALTVAPLQVHAVQETRPNAESKLPASIADFTKSFRRMPGYFNLYWDEKSGKVFLEVDKWETEFLFLDSLPGGIGSNDIGMDRGQIGEGRVVKWIRSGPKVLLEQVNEQFRASGDPLERKSVADAFAQSVLWGGTVSAEGDGGRALVDITSLALTDFHKVSEAIKRTKEGTFKVDAARSAVYMPGTRNFPQNTELESVLTFAGDDPGKYLQQVSPDPRSVTVREHYSFVQLPGPGYKPRRFDPRSGFIDNSYADYSAPIGQSLEQRFIIRHRLEKRDPNAAVSDPVKPIVYYLDPATPEPVRSALLEGARWWNQAFEAAGYRNAFQVQMLPADADPLDVRYNVIEWVHRATRGWSYGEAVVDPRTGEIIKGHVSLGSLRMRQDYMILQGLLSAYKNGSEGDPRISKTVLARLRQLAAHEVGHTLGLQHNYIASTENRASVMDYPHPLITLDANGGFDLDKAYATGIGEWDKVSIRYGYATFANDADASKVLEDALHRGLRFLTDQDARPPGSPNPYTHLWDSGTNAVDELNRVLQVRAQALKNFGEGAIKPGESMALLEDVLVPVYLYHRYQTEAAVKVIGGMDYTYALRGDGQNPTIPVAAAEQRRALDAVLKTIAPETLAIPPQLAALIPPHPSGIPRTRESFPAFTGMTFDPIAAAQSAIENTVSLLLNSERAERLLQAHAADPQSLGFGEVVDALISRTWQMRPQSEITRVAGDVVVQHLMMLASDDKASPEVRGMAATKLNRLRTWATGHLSTPDSDDNAHLFAATMAIRNFEEGTAQPLKAKEPIEIPPGAPIGSDVEPDFAVNHP